MNKVRWVGTENPASSAYAAAAMNAPPATANLGGDRRGGQRRSSQDSAAALRPASMVMCRPEIEIKCVRPVAENSCQSSRAGFDK